MLMNKVETMLVTSPANRAFQRCVEAPMLRRLGGRTPGAQALEIGCGSGYGTKLIIDQFGAATVDAIDLDATMVARARRRLHRYSDQVRVEQGSADDLRSALGAGDASYDAVFDLGIIHHITNWRDAVAEAAQRLAPRRDVLLPRGHRSRTRPAQFPYAPRPPHQGPFHRRAVPGRTREPRTRPGRQLAHLLRQRLCGRRRPTILTSPPGCGYNEPDRRRSHPPPASGQGKCLSSQRRSGPRNRLSCRFRAIKRSRTAWVARRTTCMGVVGPGSRAARRFR